MVRVLGARPDAAGCRGRINADTNAALAHASVKPRFEELGADPKGSTQAELAAFLKSEIDKWGPLIQEAKLRVEN